ncbi:hypothetical protein CJF35_03290 [Pseudomonas lundensis]|uniref:Uncharacterized protein n=1 Tax=Pseudomonas saxonica TaxID=2600598 RepID=A0ABY3GEV0_9PSED|nr:MULTISPECIES: hypothetical protein [Pseudomonas]MDH0798591.1 hypothetical protein [Pseudomonas carnis]OZY38606.1 hypothetical protein CJF35_03290 [Pseudomonas lundensis]TWR87888.1 hypothetical protein FJD38_17860 [Pseudomonas saxonica]
MHPGQTRFPYILITDSAEVVAKAAEISSGGTEEARGIISFQSDLAFSDVAAALKATGGEVGLLQIENSQAVKVKGDVARLLGKLTSA